MDRNSETNSIPEPVMCRNCMVFYGSNHTDNMCSKCYRESNSKVQQKKTEETKIVEPEIQPTAPEAEVSKKPIQTNTSACWNCSGKVGLMGHQCKCEYIFCKKHRLPESHDCDFDFQSQGKAALAKNNPAIKSSKLEKF